MSYRALYRVFRPQTFGEVCGQEHITQTLSNALKNNRLAHAYLFCGPRGTGKTSSAKILAKAVNCLHPNQAEPCNACENCRAINEDRFLDVLEIDAASNRGIDEMRDLRDKVKFAPSQGKKKVYIIDEVHMLTNEAFNALLKTLEEPPEYAMFILATTDPQKVPATILSRCQRFDFRKIGNAAIGQRLSEILQQQGIQAEDGAVQLIVRKADGGLRDAISILDQCISFCGDYLAKRDVQSVIGMLSEEETAELVQDILDANYAGIFARIADVCNAGKSVRQLLRDLMDYTRALLLLKVAEQSALIELPESILPTAKAQSKSVTVAFLSAWIARLSETEQAIRYAQQPQILVEAALVDCVLLRQGANMVIAPPQIAAEQAAGNAANNKPTTVISKDKDQAPKRAESANIAKIKLESADDIVKHWPAIMKEVKTQSIRIFAFLQEGQPMGLENGELVLCFRSPNKFHSDKIAQPENKTLIEGILEKMTGKAIKLKVYYEENKGDFAQTYDVVAQAVSAFGEAIVEVKE